MTSTANGFAPITQVLTSVFTPGLATPAATSNAALATAGAVDNSSSGLKSSAKIGIGLGIPLAIIVLAMLSAGVLYIRRRRLRRSLDGQNNDVSADTIPTSDGWALDDKRHSPKDTVQSTQDIDPPVYATELPESPSERPELAGSPGERRHELPAGGNRH